MTGSAARSAAAAAGRRSPTRWRWPDTSSRTNAVGAGGELASTVSARRDRYRHRARHQGGAAGALVAVLAVHELAARRTPACAGRPMRVAAVGGTNRNRSGRGRLARRAKSVERAQALRTARPGSPTRSAGGRAHSADGARARRRSRRVAIRAPDLLRTNNGVWPTVRRDGGRLVMAAWCHGAPGIALARACAPADAWPTRRSRRRDRRGDGPRRSRRRRSQLDHLCCGNLGRADVALTVGLRTAREAWIDGGLPRSHAVAARVRSQAVCGMRGRGFQSGAPAPEFFQGLAGIGYQLLRPRRRRRSRRYSRSNRRAPAASFDVHRGGRAMTALFGAYHIDALQPADVSMLRKHDVSGLPASARAAARPRDCRSEPEQRLFSPSRLAARRSENPVALALAELPAAWRGRSVRAAVGLRAPRSTAARGIGTALVAAIEEALERARRRVGRGRLHDRQAVDCGRRADLREARAGNLRALRTITVRFTMAEALATPWYGRMGLLPARRRDLFLDRSHRGRAQAAARVERARAVDRQQPAALAARRDRVRSGVECRPPLPRRGRRAG